MPIELGHRLPEPILSPLLDDLRDGGSFLGRFGYATEALDSPFFNPQGYWRGPIWPSASHLIHTGLRDAKATDLAHKVAKRWCAMVAADPVFWEDYDPINGTGNDSPGMSWTAAVFIRFAASLATGSSPDRPTPTLP
jgi:glycogen debranching enzyme